jgi:methionyl-tRNA formyltransferase
MKKLAVITYDCPHKKTQDILIKLCEKDYNITVIAMPFVKRDRSFVYSHRPDMSNAVSTKKLCELFGYEYHKSDKPADIMDELNIDVGIIGGAGIIDPGNKKIINSHPGYLPNVRGLDALKWAIYNGQPIGVTTHVIDNKPDAGYLIDREIIRVGFYDTFHLVAQRQYELEIAMIVRAIDRPVGEKLDTGYMVHGRMPVYYEPIMMERFENIRKKSTIQ